MQLKWKVLPNIIFSDECTEAESRSWHTQHFTCAHCTINLGGQKYVIQSTKAYCCPCYEQLFAQVCNSCGNVIGIDEGQMTYENQHWHADKSCFCCLTCQKPLLGLPFLPKDKHIYCSIVCSKVTHIRNDTTPPVPSSRHPSGSSTLDNLYNRPSSQASNSLQLDNQRPKRQSLVLTSDDLPFCDPISLQSDQLQRNTSSTRVILNQHQFSLTPFNSSSQFESSVNNKTSRPSSRQGSAAPNSNSNNNIVPYTIPSVPINNTTSFQQDECDRIPYIERTSALMMEEIYATGSDSDKQTYKISEEVKNLMKKEEDQDSAVSSCMSSSNESYTHHGCTTTTTTDNAQSASPTNANKQHHQPTADCSRKSSAPRAPTRKTSRLTEMYSSPIHHVSSKEEAYHLPSRSLPDLSGTLKKSNLKSNQDNLNLTNSNKNVSFNPLVAERSRSNSLPKASEEDMQESHSDSEQYYFLKNDRSINRVSADWLLQQTRSSSAVGNRRHYDYYTDSDSSSSSDDDDDGAFYPPYLEQHAANKPNRPQSVYGRTFHNSFAMKQTNGQKPRPKTPFSTGYRKNKKISKSKCKVS